MSEFYDNELPIIMACTGCGRQLYSTPLVNIGLRGAVPSRTIVCAGTDLSKIMECRLKCKRAQLAENEDVCESESESEDDVCDDCGLYCGDCTSCECARAIKINDRIKFDGVGGVLDIIDCDSKGCKGKCLSIIVAEIQRE